MRKGRREEGEEGGREEEGREGGRKKKKGGEKREIK